MSARATIDALRVAGTRMALLADARPMSLDQLRPPRREDTGYTVQGAGAVDVRAATTPEPSRVIFILRFVRDDITPNMSDSSGSIVRRTSSESVGGAIDGATAGASDIDGWISVYASSWGVSAATVGGYAIPFDVDADGLDDAVLLNLPEDPEDPWDWEEYYSTTYTRVVVPPREWSMRLWSRSATRGVREAGPRDAAEVSQWVELADLGRCNPSIDVRILAPARVDVWPEVYDAVAPSYQWGGGMGGDVEEIPGLVCAVVLGAVQP